MTPNSSSPQSDVAVSRGPRASAGVQGILSATSLPAQNLKSVGQPQFTAPPPDPTMRGTSAGSRAEQNSAQDGTMAGIDSEPPRTAPSARPAQPLQGGAERAAFDALRLALTEEHVYAALTGPPGTGKTALLEAVLKSPPGRKLRTIRIERPDLVNAKLAGQLEQIALLEGSKPENADRHVIVAVDDAHSASDVLLRCLARLAASARTGQRLPQVLLVGRPELWDRLTADGLEPLARRLAVRPMLPQPAAEDASAPIEQELTQARNRVAPASRLEAAVVTSRSSSNPPRTPEPVKAASLEGPVLGAQPKAQIERPSASPSPPSGSENTSSPAHRSALDSLLAQGSPKLPEAAGHRSWANLLLPLAILIGTGAVALIGLATIDWPPQRLAATAWTTVDRYLPVQLFASDEAARKDQMEQTPESATPPLSHPVASSAPITAGIPETATAPPTESEQLRPVVILPAAPMPAVAPALQTAEPPRPANAVFHTLEGSTTTLRVPVLAQQTAEPAAPVRASLPPTLPASAPRSVPSPTPAPVEPVVPIAEPQHSQTAAPLPLSPEIVALLLRRGAERLSLGDLSAARLLFERAAEAGNAMAARLLAQTYDASFVPRAEATTEIDREAAITWYRRSAVLGDLEAAQRLHQLGGAQ